MESSRSHKHSYADVPVFQHNELDETADDMKIFASVVSAKFKQGNVRSVYLKHINFRCYKVYGFIKPTVLKICGY